MAAQALEGQLQAVWSIVNISTALLRNRAGTATKAVQ